MAEAVISGVLPGRTLSSAPARPARRATLDSIAPRDPSAEERCSSPGSSLPDLGFNEAKRTTSTYNSRLKSWETNEDRFGAAGEKWAETFLETTWANS